MSSLFKTKPATTTSTSTVTLPDWLQSAYQGLVGNAQTASGMGMTPEEQAAMDLIMGNVQNYQGGHDTAVGAQTSLLDKAMSGGPTAQDLEAGMNPYLQMVLDRQRKESQKSFYSGLSQLGDQETAAGAFGGSRSAVAQETLRDNHSDNLDKLMGEGLFNAFETSRNQYNLNTQNAMAGSVNLTNQATAGQQGVIASGNAMASAGAMPRNIEQGNVSFLNSVIAPAAQSMAGKTETATQSGGGGSMFSKLLGAGLSIAGMASGVPGLGAGIGGLFGTTGGGFIGGLTGTGMSAGQLAAGAASNSMWGPFQQFADGGLVGEDPRTSYMPEWIANAPDLTWDEKLAVWEREGFPQGQPQGKRKADMVRANEEDQATMKPYLSKSDPTGEQLLDDVLNGLLGDRDTDAGIPKAVDKPVGARVTPFSAPSPKGFGQGSAGAKPSGGSLIERGLFGKGELPPESMQMIQDRHPQFQQYLDKVNAMSPEDLEALFTLDESELTRTGYPKGKATPMQFADGGYVSPEVAARRARARLEHDPRTRTPILFDEEYFGVNPEAMTADEEAMYWANNKPPTLEQILALKQSAALPKGATNAYLKGSGPAATEDSAGRVGLFEKYLGGEPGSMSVLSKDGRANLSNAVGGVADFAVDGATNLNALLDRADTDLDDLRNNTKGKNNLQRIVDPALSYAGEALLAPVKIGRAIPGLGADIGEYLAQDPDVANAEDIFANLRLQADMTSAERKAAEGLAPMEKVAEVTSAKGKTIPVETAVKPTAKEVAKAVIKEENKPQEERGMNVPLILAGIALMTTTNDPFASVGEGLAAYLGGKEMIKKAAKDDKKAAREEALAERAMNVEEGKLSVLRKNLELEAAKISAESKGGMKPKDVQDAISDRFGKILTANMDALKPGEETNMNDLINSSYAQAVSLLKGEVAPVSTPLEQLLAATQAAKNKKTQ